MRKNLLVVLSATMILAMTGCSSDDKTTTTVADTTVAATTTVADTTVADTTVADTTVADTTEEATTVAEDEEETVDPNFNPVVGDDDDYWNDNGDGNNENFEYIGEKLREEFLNQAASTTDIQAIAEAVSNIDLCGYDCGTMEVSEGYLTGFDDEISGFTNGVVFMPWIGSVPFVGYVFETEDTEALIETLKASANPRWNICTEAAETVVETSGNLVFFAMCPGPDEF